MAEGGACSKPIGHGKPFNASSAEDKGHLSKFQSSDFHISTIYYCCPGTSYQVRCSSHSCRTLRRSQSPSNSRRRHSTYLSGTSSHARTVSTHRSASQCRIKSTRWDDSKVAHHPARHRPWCMSLDLHSGHRSAGTPYKVYAWAVFTPRGCFVSLLWSFK